MKRISFAAAITFVLAGFLLVPSQLRAQTAPPKVRKASAIQVLMVQSDEIKLPAEFQIALYEDMIQQLQKKGGFEHVYREGDHNADAVADLIVFHGTVRGFKQGSEMARNVTTVAGKTEIAIHCQFTDKDGKSVLEQDLKGKVRFVGGNLRATLDFAKKAAKLSHDSFVANQAS